MSLLLQPKTEELLVNKEITLESGYKLSSVTIQYSIWGQRNIQDSNVVWIFHALTGNSNPAEWWSGLFGNASGINPQNNFIICSNSLGSCYGTKTIPELTNITITIRDIVKIQKILRDHLGVKKIHIGIGGSLGGQQLLQWAVDEPEFFEIIIPIATNAVHSPWGIAFNEAQRMALENQDEGKGLETARAIAMLSYRSYEAYNSTQKDNDNRWDHFSASSYQRYQGEKLRRRFTKQAYYLLSKAMDSHNLGRNDENLIDNLKKIKSKTLVIGINSDLLFPLSEQKFLSDNIPNANLGVIQSKYGHDAFLIELEQLNQIISKFLQNPKHEL